jgi:hypothetical protein
MMYRLGHKNDDLVFFLQYKTRSLRKNRDSDTFENNNSFISYLSYQPIFVFIIKKLFMKIHVCLTTLYK